MIEKQTSLDYYKEIITKVRDRCEQSLASGALEPRLVQANRGIIDAANYILQGDADRLSGLLVLVCTLTAVDPKFSLLLQLETSKLRQMLVTSSVEVTAMAPTGTA